MHKIKKPRLMSGHKFLERRGWDSNPRYAINVHTLSKRDSLWG